MPGYPECSIYVNETLKKGIPASVCTKNQKQIKTHQILMVKLDQNIYLSVVMTTRSTTR